MKLIVDIDKDYFEILKYEERNGNDFKPIKLIANGTPLPKKHGDLIDRQELKKEVYTTTEWNGDIHRIIYEASIDDAPTIIEADKENKQ